MTGDTQGKRIPELRQPLTATDVFALGGSIEYLIRIKQGDPVAWDNGCIEKDQVGFALLMMKSLEGLLKRHGLGETQYSRLATLIRDFEVKYARPEPPPLDEVDRVRLRTLIERIEAVVTEGLTRRNFAELTPLEGMLDYKRLLSEGSKGLLTEAGKVPSPSITYDVDEAIRCLSYGAPTASVMIGLRAVEGMVRELHRVITGKKSTNAWADLLDDVEKDLRSRGEQPPLLLGYLDYIRDVRNKADHPDKIFALREAEQIFMHVIYTIQEIQKL